MTCRLKTKRTKCRKCNNYRFLQRATAEARRSSSTASRAEWASPQFSLLYDAGPDWDCAAISFQNAINLWRFAQPPVRTWCEKDVLRYEKRGKAQNSNNFVTAFMRIKKMTHLNIIWSLLDVAFSTKKNNNFLAIIW